MRFAFFVQYCHEAGTYYRWHNLAKAMVLNGHDVDVYAGDFNYRAKKRVEFRDGVRYMITPSLITSRIFGNPSDPFTAFYRSLQKTDGIYDVYHLFQPFLQAFLPWHFLKLRRKAIFLYDWDDLWAGGLFGAAKSFREKYTHAVVGYLETKLPTVSGANTLCSSFLKEKQHTTKPTFLLYNGFWSKHYLEGKQVIREKLGFHPQTFYLAYIGKTAAELNWIYEAVKKLSITEIDFKLVIAGPPETQIRSIGLSEMPFVQYLGEISSTAAIELSRAVDLGLMPLEDNAFNQSRFPIKFFDFLSAGTPIYFSGVGEVDNIAINIVGAIKGTSSKASWSENLVKVVKSLIDTPVTVDIEHLEKKYSWISIADELVQFYAEQKTF